LTTIDLFNNEAEALVLAGFLKNPGGYWSLNDVGLRHEDFLGGENRRVMRAIEAVTNDKKEPDLPNVIEALRQQGQSTTIDYLSRLQSLPVSVAQARDYARTVKGLSVSRQLATVGAQITSIAAEKRADADAAVAEAESLIRQVAQSIPQPDRSPDMTDILRRVRQGGTTTSIPIRFSPTLQDLSGGLFPGHLWVIGGFSSTGKSAVACNFIADILAEPGKVAALISTEMTQEQYAIRMLSLLSGVPQRTIRDRLLVGLEEIEAVKKAETYLGRSNLRIFDTVSRIDDIRSNATRLKETIGLDVLLVDFIQNVQGTVGDFAFGDMTGVSITLQQLAKDLRCTVIAFSQVSNEMAKWDAQGGDEGYYAFKGSGAIKDAADLAIMLKRDRIRKSETLDINVVKNRHGEMRVIPTHMNLPTGKITEMYIEEEE
jgi:replicative DNA helicase